MLTLIVSPRLTARLMASLSVSLPGIRVTPMLPPKVTGVWPTKTLVSVTGSVPVRFEKRKRSMVPLNGMRMG